MIEKWRGEYNTERRIRRSATARLPRRPVTLTRHREPYHSPGL